MSFQDNLEDFKDILLKLLTFIYSEYKNSFTHDIFTLLKLKIKFYKIDSTYNKDQLVNLKKEFVNYTYESSDLTVDYTKCNDIVNFVRNIADQAHIDVITNITSKEDRNIYCNKQFAELLLRVTIQFVLWTKVMTTVIDCNIGDNYCNIIYNYQKDIEDHLSSFHSKPNVDEYLLKIIDHTDAKLEIAKKFKQKLQPYKTQNEIKINKQNEIEIDYIFHQENWKGLNDDSPSDNSEESHSSTESTLSDSENSDLESEFLNTNNMNIVESICQEMCDKDVSNPVDAIDDVFKKESSNYSNSEDLGTNENQDQLKVRRGKFLEPCPDIELLEQIPIGRRRLRKVIKNCNYLKPRKVNNIKVTVVTSSYFDSILEVMISAYFMIKKFQDYVDNDTNVFDEIKQRFFHILYDYVNNFNTSKLDNGRITLLNDICNTSKIAKFSWTKSILVKLIQKTFVILAHLICR